MLVDWIPCKKCGIKVKIPSHLSKDNVICFPCWKEENQELLEKIKRI